MSANRIRVRNNPLNFSRTNDDRRAYRAEQKKWAKAINAAKTDEESAAIWRERDSAMKVQN